MEVGTDAFPMLPSVSRLMQAIQLFLPTLIMLQHNVVVCSLLWAARGGRKEEGGEANMVGVRPIPTQHQVSRPQWKETGIASHSSLSSANPFSARTHWKATLMTLQ